VRVVLPSLRGACWGAMLAKLQAARGLPPAERVRELSGPGPPVGTPATLAREGGGGGGAAIQQGGAPEAQGLQANAHIQELPVSVALKVRGGSHAPNIASYMLQLMYNALDAKATSIAVKICLRTFTLQVRDDGHGMVRVKLSARL
jgi:hypothetical protein